MPEDLRRLRVSCGELEACLEKAVFCCGDGTLEFCNCEDGHMDRMEHIHSQTVVVVDRSYYVVLMGYFCPLSHHSGQGQRKQMDLFFRYL